MKKPTVFISSSSEGLDIAYALQDLLRHDANTVVLSNQVFNGATYSFESLLRSLDTVDFAIVVLTPDDLVLQRGSFRTTPRDNIIFELGFCVGRLGRSRTFIVMDDEDYSNFLPTDLIGVTVARINRSKTHNLLESLGPTSLNILRQIEGETRNKHSLRPQAIVEYYSCFISYSADDGAFAEKLYNDLQEVGIRCWLDSKDLKIGDNIAVQINKAIQTTDKLLLVLSKASIKSAWVRHEIKALLQKESEAHETILFPIRIDNTVMTDFGDSATALAKSKHIGDFSQWTNRDSYKRAFSRLVKDLTVSAAAEQDRNRPNA